VWRSLKCIHCGKFPDFKERAKSIESVTGEESLWAANDLTGDVREQAIAALFAELDFYQFNRFTFTAPEHSLQGAIIKRLERMGELQRRSGIRIFENELKSLFKKSVI
jgi:hypothetical protein